MRPRSDASAHAMLPSVTKTHTQAKLMRRARQLFWFILIRGPLNIDGEYVQSGNYIALAALAQKRPPEGSL